MKKATPVCFSKPVILLCLFLTCSSLWGQTDTIEDNVYSVEELLAGYIAHDSEIQWLLIQLEKSQLSKKSADISSGFNVNLSTGNFTMSADTMKLEPLVSVSVPKWNNVSVSASVPVNIVNENDKTQLEGASVSVGADIIGGSGKQTQLSILTAERSLLEAQRAVENRALSAEKEFYTTLKNIYSQYGNVLTAQDDVYDKQIDLETVRIGGYSTSSSSYRTAELELMTAERKVLQLERELQRSLNLFAKDCGLSMGVLTVDTLPMVDTVVIQSGILDGPYTDTLENFSAMDSAQWNLTSAQLSKEAAGMVTLSAQGGYTYKNQQQKGSDTIDVGVTLNTFGANLKGGLTFPVTGDSKVPSAQLSLSWSPDSMREQSIQQKQNTLNVELAQLKIADAEEEYYLALEANELTWTDLVWNRQVKSEEYALYEQLASDTETWYKQGLVSETDYRRAMTNRDNALLQTYLSDIDLILNSIETKQMFIQETK